MDNYLDILGSTGAKFPQTYYLFIPAKAK